MNILGVSFGYHDAAAAIIMSGSIVAAAQEERFSRKKHDPAYPARSIDFCLSKAGINADQLDLVVYYEQPLLKLDRILKAYLAKGKDCGDYLESLILNWKLECKFTPLDIIAKRVGFPREKVLAVKHHQAHAAAAFFPSPFTDATVVTIDGIGEYETLTVSMGSGNTLSHHYSLKLPHSLGLFYSAFTAFLGFEVNEGEYKVMGMAAFGKPVHAEAIRKLIKLTPDGLFEIEQECFDFFCPLSDMPFNDKFIKYFGLPRHPEKLFSLSSSVSVLEGGGGDQFYADIASSLQLVTEEVVLHVVRSAVKKTGVNKICMAGGVALNSAANGRLAREFNGRLYIHPAAGDSGCALGAALYAHHCLANFDRITPLNVANLGRSYGDKEIEVALHRSGMRLLHLCANKDELISRTAEFLAEGKVVGWAQDRFEYGPRSLGFRSILADPTLPEMQNRVNEKIKFRESFRPFAPAVPDEMAEDFFEIIHPDSCSDPSYFMLLVVKVRENKRNLLSAITHVDGTARVQLVNKGISPIFHGLLLAFGKLRGVPVLLNTSFNLRGEPIVASPDDAMKTFSWSNIDYLVFNNYIIDRKIVL